MKKLRLDVRSADVLCAGSVTRVRNIFPSANVQHQEEAVLEPALGLYCATEHSQHDHMQILKPISALSRADRPLFTIIDADAASHASNGIYTKQIFQMHFVRVSSTLKFY